MPRWARFVSCSFTGLLVSLIGMFAAAYWWEGRSDYWQGLLNYLTTPAFWFLVASFGLLTAVGLLVARVAVKLYNMAGGLAGLAGGGLVALVYVAFLVSVRAGDWGGMAIAAQKAWPAGIVFAVPFAVSGAFTAWLWDRLRS